MTDLSGKLDEGIHLLGKLETSSAVKCFEETTREDAENGVAWIFLGDLYLLDGKIEDAKTAHTRAEEIDSELNYPQVDAIVRKGQASWHVRLDQNLSAKVIYQDTIGVMYEFENRTSFLTLSEPENKERIVIPSDADVKLGRTESLLALISPMYPVLAGMLASNLVLFESMIREEIRKREASLGKDEDSDVWAEQGMALESIDQIDESALAYSNSLKINPRNRCAQRGILKVLARAKTGWKISNHMHHPIAQSMINQLSKFAQSPELSQFKRSTDFIISQNDILSLAIRSFVFFDQKEAVSFNDLRNMGGQYYDIRDYQIAVLFLEKALALEAEDKESLRSLALSLFEMRKFSVAESYLSKLVKIDSKNSDVWTKYGLSALAVGKIEESESSFRKAVAIDSNNILAWLNLSTVLMQVGKCDEARDIMIKLQGQIPSEFMRVLQDTYGEHCM